MSVIICGSRKYNNLCFNDLVDTFDTIVRTNMLLPNSGYGKRESDYQSLNCHIYYKYKHGVSLEEWLKYEKRVGVPKDHIKKFKNYLDSASETKFITFSNNNTQAFRNFFKKNNINLVIHQQLRNGFSYLGECLEKDIKPFLIGFSLREDCYDNHQYLGKIQKINNSDHNIKKEIEIIKILHNNNFIDATFCCIEDNKNLTIDNSIIEPTKEGIHLWKKIYEKYNYTK